MQNYGVISKALTELLKRDYFQWNPQANEAFEKLKAAMSEALVLALPDFSQPFVLEIDVSNVGVGVVLMQGVGL